MLATGSRFRKFDSIRKSAVQFPYSQRSCPEVAVRSSDEFTREFKYRGKGSWRLCLSESQTLEGLVRIRLYHDVLPIATWRLHDNYSDDDIQFEIQWQVLGFTLIRSENKTKLRTKTHSILGCADDIKPNRSVLGCECLWNSSNSFFFVCENHPNIKYCLKKADIDSYQFLTAN